MSTSVKAEVLGSNFVLDMCHNKTEKIAVMNLTNTMTEFLICEGLHGCFKEILSLLFCYNEAIQNGKHSRQSPVFREQVYPDVRVCRA